MSKKINTKKPIRFYDDRGKSDGFIYLDKILFEDNEVCLCTFKGETWVGDENFKKILFKKKYGEVVNEDYGSWYAENYKK